MTARLWDRVCQVYSEGMPAREIYKRLCSRCLLGKDPMKLNSFRGTLNREMIKRKLPHSRKDVKYSRRV